ncbi:MAG: HlyC/CorC family transporter [Lachnospiraceae bacterium]|nr:HlyC/CorC family transporter [Lachnospiraceae bacterium]
MDTPGVIQSIIIVILLGLSAFFSSAETAFSTVNRVRMRALEEEGNKRATVVIKILDNYGKMISTILIGNNIVNISVSSLMTTLVIRLTGGNTYVGIATGALTILVLIFGEITPKNWAKSYAESISLAYCKIILSLMKILTPVIFIVDLLAKGIMKLLHIDPNKKDIMTENELKTYVDVSHEDGVIESEEREMIYNVFDLSDSQAKDVMIPRINMVTVSEDASYDELLEIFRDSMYTRIPVYKEDQDNIIGLVNIKDFFLTSDKDNFHISDIMREAYYTYEFKRTSDLMFEMRAETFNVAFILNEYGATVGMITLEDLLEEIVGEIRDEYDEDEEEFIQEISERTYLVEGSMKLDDINDALDTDLESEDYDSIGGIIIGSLDRLPEDNEEVTLENGIALKVQGIEQNRILKVQMVLPEKNSDEEENDSEDSE